MTIDKSWIKLRDRRSTEFLNGLTKFIDIARKHVNNEGKVRCPCVHCVNRLFEELDTVYAHIHDKGFLESYTIWHHHGEELPTILDDIWGPMRTTTAATQMFEAIEDIFAEENTNEENIDIGEGIGLDPEYDALFEEVNCELYRGCSSMSSLNFTAKLLHIKAMNKVTDTAMDQILELLKISFPKENMVPSSYYEARKKLKKIGLGYHSIHACVNDCVLFYQEHMLREICPVCEVSRWVDKDTKGKKVPQKVLRYFPVTSRLRRRYGSRLTAKDMIWHHTGHSTDQMMRHPVDGKAWQEFDKRYPDFAKEPRNVRLGLAADGFNPFGNFSSAHSTWPVILTTYNTPPWLCMKESSFMLTLLIPGPKSPAKDIDVFLRPLVDELKVLWKEGVRMRDAATNTIFTMRAALLWTINDYPARSSLSGWSGQGYKACPTCNEDTPSCPVKDKIAYVGHRRFLGRNHRWRKSLLFDNKKETRSPPRKLTNARILEQLARLPNLTPGKHPSHGGVKRKRLESELNWTKRSIFYDLAYWSSLDLKHNLDVMHVEKNVCESLLYTLLDTEKTKDTPKARQHLQKMGIRKNLWLQEKKNKSFKPRAPFTFKIADRKRFCRFIKRVRLPDGFGSNFKKKVPDSESTLTGLKSHDCHILMQRLLPIGVRAGLDVNVATVIIELCTFFKKICARSLKVDDMFKAQEELIKILCNLELIFPPAFFDIMIHIVLHLPEEAILGGPVFMRWMYPFERYMKKLKNYVRNKARPEGSIAEGYIAEEALTFCSMYLEDVQTKFNRPDRNDDAGKPKRQLSVFSTQWRPLSKGKSMAIPRLNKTSLQWFVLDNCNELDGYKAKFKSEQPDSDQKTNFAPWFYNKIFGLERDISLDCTDEVEALAHGPLSACSYTACIVNGVRYVAESRDCQRTTQNNGIVVSGTDGFPFYGVLEEIIELKYINSCSVVIFRGKWFNTSGNSRHIKKQNIVSIDISHEWYIGHDWYDTQQYSLAIHAKQVFYLEDPSRNDNWRVVEEVNHRKLWDHPSISVTNEIDVDTCSSNFAFDVDVGDLPFMMNSEEVGELIEVVESHDAPVVDGEGEEIDNLPSDCEGEEFNDDNNDNLVDPCYSSDEYD